jgi:predicted glutamine amidotransferase
MCRMVGVVYRDEFPMETLTDLRHLSGIGKIPDEDELGHRDGWGIVSFRNGTPRYIGRSPRPAFLDPSFDSALEDIPDVGAPNILIAHVRAASKGTATLANTHPFVIGNIVLGHNGTIEDFFPKTTRKPKGETDSERLALLVADRMDEEGDLGDAMRSVICHELSEHEFSSAIMLASDGKTLYGYRDYAKRNRANYYDLWISKCRGYVAFYQQTILGYGGSVSRVKKKELVSVGLDLKVRRQRIA